MGPMIDAELEAVDRRHAQLTRLSTELVDALNLYHQLMHENMSAQHMEWLNSLHLWVRGKNIKQI